VEVSKSLADCFEGTKVCIFRSHTSDSPSAGQCTSRPYERIYRQPKSAVEKALKGLQTSMSGSCRHWKDSLCERSSLEPLPRAYYQSAVAGDVRLRQVDRWCG